MVRVKFLKRFFDIFRYSYTYWMSEETLNLVFHISPSLSLSCSCEGSMCDKVIAGWERHLGIP